MLNTRNGLRLGAALTLGLGLAACANPFAGQQTQQQQAPAATTGTAMMGGTQWQDPKAPGTTRQGAGAAAGDWDDDDMDDGLDT